MEKGKEKTKKKINKKGLLVVLLSLYLIIMLFLYVWKLPVKTIIVNGNSIVTDSDIIASSEIDNNTKLITLSLNNLKKKLLDIPFIESVEVKKSIDGTLTINVTEVKVLFYNKLNDSYVLSNQKETKNLPKVLGLPTLNNYVPSDKYENLINKMSKIDVNTLYLISEIEYSPDIKNDVTIDANRFLLRMNDGNIVYINLANFDNLENYQKIFTTLDGKGVLTLDSNSDKVIFTTFDALKKDEENELSE